jgi:4-amino-4-deoxy-L-arabinose transferase-like glycosyltransferase
VSTRERVTASLWAVVALLAIIRMAALLIAVSPEAPLTGDEPIYDRVARHLLAGEGYTNREGPWIWKPPGWPVTLAGIYAVAGDDRRAVSAFQGLFDTGTALLGGWVALRVFGTAFAGLAAFVTLLFWPPFFSESRFQQTEPLFTFLVTASIASFLAFTRRPGRMRGFAIGVIAALAALVRPTGLVPIGALLLAWFLFRRADAWRARGPLVFAALGLVLALTPWTIRNAVVFHGFVPISTSGGEHFYMGSTPETDGRWDAHQWVELKARVVEQEELRLGRSLDPLELDRALLRAGIENWKRDPGGSVVRTFKRLWRLVLLPVESDDRPALRIAFFLALIAVYVLAALAAVRGGPEREPIRAIARMLLFALLVNAAIGSLVYARSRYFEPVRPLALILAAGVVAAAVEKRSGNRAPGTPG